MAKPDFPPNIDRRQVITERSAGRLEKSHFSGLKSYLGGGHPSKGSH